MPDLQSALVVVGDWLRWPLRKQRWVWLLPPVMYEVTKREQVHLHTAIEALIGIAVVLLVAKRPYKALSVLICTLPFSTFILATLYRFGAPGALVRGLGFWKEGIVAGVAVAALTRMLRSRTRLDGLDRLVVAYVALGTAYLLLPKLLDGTQAGAHLSLYVRELGWRSDVLYFGIFLVCRHLGLPRQQVDALFRRFLIVAVVVAIVGVYEFLLPGSFNHVVVRVIRVPTYQARVLHAALANPNSVLVYASTGHRVRIGSLLLNYLTVGFYFVMALGVAIELISRGRARTWVVLSVPVLGAALLFTQSRAAIGGGVVTVLLGLRAQIGRSIALRVRLSALLGVALIAVLPIVVLAGLGHRFVGPAGGSNTNHSNGVRNGISFIAQHPLGRGLGTGAGGGQVAVTEGATSIGTIFFPENQWLQIGVQVGALGLVIYVAAMIVIVRRLHPRTHDPGSGTADAWAGGARTALIGVLVGGLFLQTFVEPIVSWTVFALCGMAVGAMDSRRSEVEPYASPVSA